LEESNQPLPLSIPPAPCSTATSDSSENTAQSSFLLTSSVYPEEPLSASPGPSSSNDNTCHNAFMDLDPDLLAPTESKVSKGTLIFSRVRSTTQAGFDYDSVTFRIKSKVKKNQTSKHLAQKKQVSYLNLFIEISTNTVVKEYIHSGQKEEKRKRKRKRSGNGNGNRPEPGE